MSPANTRRLAPFLTRPARRRRGAGGPVPPHRHAVEGKRRVQAQGRPPAGRLRRLGEIGPGRGGGRVLRGGGRGGGEEGGGAGEGETRRRAPPGREALRQAVQHGGGHQHAGGVVEGLDRQRHRLVGAGAGHPGLGEAAAHLDQAVEAAPLPPRAGPAIGVEADIDQARPQAGAGRGVEPEPGQRVRPVAVDQHVRSREQVLEARPSARLLQVEPGAGLAEGRLRHDAGLVPGWRVEAQDRRAEPGEDAGRDGAGQHPRQVEDAQSRKRPVRPRSREAVRSGLAPVPRDQRFPGDGRSLRVEAPGARRAHRGGAAPGRHHGAFERVRPPACDRRRHRLALHRGIEHGQGRVAVMRRVGVEPDPAIGRAVIAGHRVPERRQIPPLGVERAGKPEPREAPVDGDVRSPAEARRDEFGERQPRRRDRGRREVADRVDRREGARPDDPHGRRGLGAEGAPNRLQQRREGRIARFVRHRLLPCP